MLPTVRAAAPQPPLPSAPQQADPARLTWQREQFVAAMALATTPVTVIATEGPAGRYAQTVSAVCSVSADPPTLLGCVSRHSPLAAAVTVNGCFTVNLLAPSQAEVSEVFAGRSCSWAPYDFSCAAWTARVTGAPVLVGAAATFDCELAQWIDAATHRILLGSVQDSCRWPGESLAYRQRSYGWHRPFGQPANAPAGPAAHGSPGPPEDGASAATIRPMTKEMLT
jgi:flavin reductase